MMLVRLLDFVVLVNHSIPGEALMRGGPCKSGYMNDFRASLLNLIGTYAFSSIAKSEVLNTGRFTRPKTHSAIFFKICPFLKIVIPPPLCETTMPTALVTLVIAATELCRVPIPLGRETPLESTVI